jgi:fatty-acid desaturase
MQSEYTGIELRLTTLAAMLVPLAGLIAAVWCSWGWGFTWVELGVLAGMYTATGLGVTVSFHRLFAHRSFETCRVVKVVLAVFGSMSVQGTLLKREAMHRRHHQYSDQTEDPHPPHRFGGGVWSVLAGLWHAHVGWALWDRRMTAETSLHLALAEEKSETVSAHKWIYPMRLYLINPSNPFVTMVKARESRWN